MNKSGYIYIIRNPAWPEFIKIGITDDLDKRLASYQTSSPFRDYTLLYSIYHPDYKAAEHQLKETMRPFAKMIKNEWFEVDFLVAKVRLDEILEEYQ